jgi:hypothetical protein
MDRNHQAEKKSSTVETPKDKSIYHNKSSAGKGDSPRNVSQAFWDNYDEIDWSDKEFKIIVKINENTTGEL